MAKVHIPFITNRMKDTLLNSPRFIRLLLMLALITSLYLIRQFRNQPANNSKSTSVKSSNNAATSTGQKQLMQQLASQKLAFTKHAKCRMDCRHIDDGEIKDIMHSGHINERKSDPQDAPCPTYALEGNTKDGQEVRIILGACENETKVITVIDLGKEHLCDCK